MQTISGLIALLIHLLICVLVWIGIRTHFLKGKRYLMVPVIFIPFFGVLCIGLLQLQFFLKKENSKPCRFAVFSSATQGATAHSTAPHTCPDTPTAPAESSFAAVS